MRNSLSTTKPQTIEWKWLTLAVFLVFCNAVALHLRTTLVVDETTLVETDSFSPLKQGTSKRRFKYEYRPWHIPELAKGSSDKQQSIYGAVSKDGAAVLEAYKSEKMRKLKEKNLYSANECCELPLALRRIDLSSGQPLALLESITPLTAVCWQLTAALLSLLSAEMEGVQYGFIDGRLRNSQWLAVQMQRLKVVELADTWHSDNELDSAESQEVGVSVNRHSAMSRAFVEAVAEHRIAKLHLCWIQALPSHFGNVLKYCLSALRAANGLLIVAQQFTVSAEHKEVIAAIPSQWKRKDFDGHSLWISRVSASAKHSKARIVDKNDETYFCQSL